MIGFKPVKDKEKQNFICRSDYAMTFCALDKGHFLDVMSTASFSDFLLPVAIVVITLAICSFGIIGILPMKGSYLVLVCLTSIYQPLWLFSQLLFLCLFDMQASQKASRTALMFLNFDLSEHSGLMYLGGGSLDPLFIVFTLLQRHKLDSIVQV